MPLTTTFNLPTARTFEEFRDGITHTGLPMHAFGGLCEFHPLPAGVESQAYEVMSPSLQAQNVHRSFFYAAAFPGTESLSKA
jgi:hypothetical protein